MGGAVASHWLGDEADKENKGFDFLIHRAWAAHSAEIRELQEEVRSLREKLAAAGGNKANTPDELPHSLSDVDSAVPARMNSTGSALNDEYCTVVKSLMCRSNSAISRDTGVTARAKNVVSHWKQVSREGFGSTPQRRQSQVQPQSMLHRFVQHPWFEMFIAGVIIVNAGVMSAEAQYQGFDLAVWTGHESADGVSSDVWPHAEVVFDIADWMFGTFFVFELTVRIIGLRLRFVQDLWNWVDFSIVAYWLYSRFYVYMNVNAQMVRLARLARLLRLVRLCRFLHSAKFDALYLITTSLKGSVAILAWAFSLLLILHVLLALVVNQTLHQWYFQESEAEAQVEVFEYFGSFSRSLVTMFELTLANWPQPARVLMEKVHEATFIYSIMHKMVLGFAVIGIVNGVFIQETFKVSTMDDAEMVRQASRKEKVHVAKMRRLFLEADEDKSGTVDKDEWLRICEDSWVQTWLKAQDLYITDPAGLFDHLEDGMGMLTAEALIHGTAQMKGEASPHAMARLMKDVCLSVKSIEGRLGAACPGVPDSFCIPPIARSASPSFPPQ